MQIYVHTDTNVEGNGDMAAHVQGEVATALSRFSVGLTRVEVHLGDGSAGRATDSDTRCLSEARPEGPTPLTVTDDADSVDAALSGALRRLENLRTTQPGAW